ncbi:FeS assembly SUF system protein [Azospirillum fermentarium]|uniref:iron-sulfur cluster assembly protein n=1 Tax=Azospirillum fermentarium TaxID=1233114 RepID=UPI0022265214|nr:iron-sulfur cluster assembly protein [Azospirillum fermentarium]MCW2246412.1 FeS assembly SUF system protein [Azospirillum fermentarium]
MTTPDTVSPPGDAPSGDAPATGTDIAVAGSPPPTPETAQLMERILEALKTCYDPEIPVDIWELGLIYRVDVTGDGVAEVDMTLTSPMCPVAGELPIQVQNAVLTVEGINDCKVELVWEPPWNPEMMSEVAKIQLDMF